jgi:ATP-dependent DNA helicase PIF1
MGWLIFIGVVIYIVYQISKSGNSSSSSSRNHGQSGYTSVSYQKPPTPNKKLNEDQVFIENIKLSTEQQSLFDKIENSNEHFFITGKAGTGKSVLLQYLKYRSKKKLVVGAFTGIAALNVGGQTLNSLFRLPTDLIQPDNVHLNGNVATLLRNVDTVVIDEISMVRVDMMEAIDMLLRQARRSELPFGGTQIVMFGDVYQLPPVVADRGLHEYFSHNYGGPYFFNAPVWIDAKLNIFELTHNFRQKDDEEFRGILNAIRTNDVGEEVLNSLNLRCFNTVPTENAITVAPKNDTVNQINAERLAELTTPLFEYRAEISGNLERTYFPTEEYLRLKKGAQVMLLKNDPEKRWVNGTVGVVEELSSTEIKVKINGDIIYSIPKATWQKIAYYYDQETRTVEQRVLSSFTQFPIRLAWAFTIHKSQGKTYNSVVVNMEGGAFAHGQTYVALSRCVSLNGLYLTQPIKREDIIVDPLVISFMSQVIVEEAKPIVSVSHKSRGMGISTVK